MPIGFSTFRMPEIVGRAMKENTGSIRVLEKTGLVYKKTVDSDGHEEVIYSLVNPFV